MDVQQLAYFIALSETLNYTAAARKCFISRQGLRQAVRSLEEEFGVTLIDNTKNHLTLTDAGQIFAAKAADVLASCHELSLAMRNQVICTAPLKIGISRSLLPFYGPKIASRAEQFSEEYPGIETHISTMSADAIMLGLEQGQLDAGIIVDMPEVSYPYQRTVLQQDELVIFMGSGHPLAAKDELILKDLDGQEVLIMSNPAQCFSPLQEALRREGVTVQYTIAPDYYEVGYRVLNSKCLAIDREFGYTLPRHGRLDTNLALEQGRFTLTVSLLASNESSEGLRFFRKYMMEGIALNLYEE